MAGQRLRRSCLAVPGSSPKMLAKAAGLPADQVFLDLEDAVAPLEKNDETRQHIVDALNDQSWLARTKVVRVNDVGTRWCFRDIAYVVEGAGAVLDCIMLPKAETPGDVQFVDRLLLAADAVITTRQESAYAALTQASEMHGPPAYFTQDWVAAEASAAALAALRPEILVPGHGRAMRGEEMRTALTRLAQEFDRYALPARGTYVEEPARAEDGSAYDRASSGRG